MAMDVTAVQSQVGISMLRKTMDLQSAMAAKLLDGLDKASAAVNAASSQEPGKGQYIDVRA